MEIIIYDEAGLKAKVKSGLKNLLWMIISAAVWVAITALFINVGYTFGFIKTNFGFFGGSELDLHIFVFSPLICAVIVFFLIFTIRVFMCEKDTRKNMTSSIFLNMCTVWRNIGIIFFIIVIVSGFGLFLLALPAESLVTLGLVVVLSLMPKFIKTEGEKYE
jgi:hypothetical protein